MHLKGRKRIKGTAWGKNQLLKKIQCKKKELVVQTNKSVSISFGEKFIGVKWGI